VLRGHQLASESSVSDLCQIVILSLVSLILCGVCVSCCLLRLRHRRNNCCCCQAKYSAGPHVRYNCAQRGVYCCCLFKSAVCICHCCVSISQQQQQHWVAVHVSVQANVWVCVLLLLSGMWVCPTDFCCRKGGFAVLASCSVPPACMLRRMAVRMAV
jgi:hypothetical protein